MAFPDVLKTSKSDSWTTPEWLFKYLDREFGFTLDPCCNKETALCSKFYTEKDNGLTQDWGQESVFVNPPYSNVINWMAKAHSASRKGATVVCLVPSRTDTRWWHSFAMKGEIRFIKGRLKFGDSKHNAPFPSAIIVFKPGWFQITTIQSEIEKRRFENASSK